MSVAHDCTGTEEGDGRPTKGEGSPLLSGDEARPLTKRLREPARAPASHPDTSQVPGPPWPSPGCPWPLATQPLWTATALPRGGQHGALHGSRAPSATSAQGPGVAEPLWLPESRILVPESSQEAKGLPSQNAMCVRVCRRACMCMAVCVCTCACV